MLEKEKCHCAVCMQAIENENEALHAPPHVYSIISSVLPLFCLENAVIRHLMLVLARRLLPREGKTPEGENIL